jgi:hypothetical protein
MAEDFAGEGATAEPPDTLVALLTAALSATLADAVSALGGAAYDAQIVRIEPHAHGGRISSSRLSLGLWTTRSPLRWGPTPSQCRCRPVWSMHLRPKAPVSLDVMAVVASSGGIVGAHIEPHTAP